MYVPQPVSTPSDASYFSSTWLRQTLLLSVAGMFSVPFMWPRHTMPIPSFYSEAVAAFVLLLAALLAICLSTNSQTRLMPRKVPYVALIFIPLIAVLCLQLAMGKLTFTGNALFPIMVMGAAIGATALGASCTRRYGHERILCWICIALVVGGCWNVAAQIVQLTKFWELTAVFSYSKGSLYGNLAQRNHLATYLVWSLIAAMYLFAKGRLRLSATIALLGVFLVGLVFTASRMSWLQVGWTAAAGAYLISRIDVALRPRYWRAMLGLPLALLIVTIVLPHSIDLMQLNFSDTAIDRMQTEGLDRNRWLIYSQVWEIFKAHPLFGIGPGELQFNQLLLMDHYHTVLFASSAHNLLLDLLVMTGLAGTAGFLWFGLGWYARVRKIPISLETTTILLILASLGIHSLLEFPEWYGFFLFSAAFLVGALETRFIIFKPNLVSRTLPSIAVVGGIGFTALLWYQYRQIESLYYTYYQGNPHAKAASVESLARLYGYRNRSFFDAPADFVLSWNLQTNSHAVTEKLVFSEHAIHYQPSATILYRHIVLLGLAKREDEALFYLTRLKAAFPSDFPLIAESLIEAGQQHPALFGRIAAETRRLLSRQ
jgi:O-antigen ligase